MNARQPRYDNDEYARRGNEIYDRLIRLQVERCCQLVALDLDTKDFEVADDGLAAARRLLERHPDAQIWCLRVGSQGVHRFGPRVRPAKS